MDEILRLKRSLTVTISGYYPPEEASALARMLLEEVAGMPYPALVLFGHKFTEKELAFFAEASRRLLAHEPIQQILGYAYFDGLKLRVTPDTLIPRPETEELCQKILERDLLRPGTRALDIGTGTGAIALFLKDHEPDAEVSAIDVDPETLLVARQNARDNVLEVSFRQMDLRAYESLGPLDLIVSNPPYILPSEREEMRPHVLDFEPPGALFVPEDDPALFYRLILEKVTPDLLPGGGVALELNPLTAEAVLRMYQDAGFKSELETDMYGRTRFLFAEKRP